MTAEQISKLSLAKRSDGTNDDWVELYRSEFPPEEQRHPDQLRKFLARGSLVLHETRDADGTLLTWSMSQDNNAREDGELSFWHGCWTVTKRSAQSTGIGRVHFAKVVAALKLQTPDYLGRVTEIESTYGLSADSQPVRRAKFYDSLGLKEIDVPYEIPLFQPADAKEYTPQKKLGSGIRAQLLFAPFHDRPLTAAEVKTIIRRIYERGYDIKPDDPYIEERLSLVDENRKDFLVPIRIGDDTSVK